MNINPAVFKRSWINTGLVKPEKEEEESLIEHFLSLQIDDEKARAQMEVQEQAPFQIPAKKPSKAPLKQLKISSYFK